MEGRRSEHRAIGKRRRDTPNWPVLANAISRTLCTKGLQSDFLAWPRIWSVSGVSELVGTSYTENRKRAALLVVRRLSWELASLVAPQAQRAPSPGRDWEHRRAIRPGRWTRQWSPRSGRHPQLHGTTWPASPTTRRALLVRERRAAELAVDEN